MNDTGNIPFWDINIGTMVIAFLCLVIILVLLLAFLGGRK